MQRLMMGQDTGGAIRGAVRADFFYGFGYDAMEKAGLPFAPIRKPADLLEDEHLLETGGLADMRLPDGPKAGETVKTTLFPITMDGSRLGVRIDPPRVGEHTAELLRGLGYSDAETAALQSRQVVG